MRYNTQIVLTQHFSDAQVWAIARTDYQLDASHASLVSVDLADIVHGEYFFDVTFDDTRDDVAELYPDDVCVDQAWYIEQQFRAQLPDLSAIRVTFDEENEAWEVDVHLSGITKTFSCQCGSDDDEYLFTADNMIPIRFPAV
jgi:hypothetical protein